jgi:hypothetical protein
MELLLTLLLAVFIGYLIGHVSTIWKLRQLIQEAATAEGIDLDEVTLEKDNIVEVYKLEVEEIDSTLYLFERETKDFVCQGSTVEELAKLSKDYKNIMMATVVHQNKVFMFVNGNSREFVG